MTKTELIDLVKRQLNIELINDKADPFNKKRNVLYTKITRNNYYNVVSLLRRKGLRYEQHIDDYYWIYLR